jgi:dTDP-glucose 4,6-dehydratase
MIHYKGIDITKARKILGWEAKVNRAEGMKITYDYFKSLSKKNFQKKSTSFSSYMK